MSFSQVSHHYEQLLEPTYAAIIGRRSINWCREFELVKQLLHVRTYLLKLLPVGRLSVYAKYLIVAVHGDRSGQAGLSVKPDTRIIEGNEITLHYNGRVQVDRCDRFQVIPFVDRYLIDSCDWYRYASMEACIVYAQRVKCMRVNLNYAQHKALDELEAQHQHFLHGLVTYRRGCLRYQQLVIEAYLFHLANQLSFNLSDQADIRLLAQIHRNIKAIQAKIESSYRAVRHKLGVGGNPP